MGRMTTQLTIGANKQLLTAGALVDTGSSVTILSNVYARALGLRTAATGRLAIGGVTRRVCYRNVDLHIPGTDCFVEKMRVAIIATGSDDVPGAIIGADLLQRTGAFLDFRKGRHALGGDVNGRDAKPADIVEARRVRLHERPR